MAAMTETKRVEEQAARAKNDIQAHVKASQKGLVYIRNFPAEIRRVAGNVVRKALAG